MAVRKKKAIPDFQRFSSRRNFAEAFIYKPNGAKWNVRDYQIASLESPVLRKCHCDGRDVGKTSEIEIIAAWASVCQPGRSMLIGTQFETHLNPLMRRLYELFSNNPLLKRNVKNLRMSPGAQFTFRNGFEIFGRIAGPNGVNFQGMHTDWQIIDESQCMLQRSWEELLPALNAGGTRWVYGVPNGIRNKFYEISKDPQWEQYLWPSRLNPGFTEDRNTELFNFYGGGDAPGYVHNVLGMHGAPEAALFDITKFVNDNDNSRDYQFICAKSQADGYACKCETCELPGGDSAKLVLGIDCGFSNDPTEMTIWAQTKTGHTYAMGRVHCANMPYPEQVDLIRVLDKINDFDCIAIDDGAAGIAVLQELAVREEMVDKLLPISFGGRLTWQPHGVLWPVTRPTKETLTGLISRALHLKRIHLVTDSERITQYGSQTAQYSRSGRIVYSKGNDHIIDADRCAFAALHRDELSVVEPQTPQGSFEPRVESC